MRLLTVAFTLLLCVPASDSAGARMLSAPKPGIAKLDSASDYLVYYGGWDADKLFRAKDFDLVILEPSAITPAQAAELRRGHDGLEGTSDDVIVIGYISLGEDYLGNRAGDGRGPCYWAWDSSRIVYENTGVASWYVDDFNRDGLPDGNATWGSYYVNAGDTLWWEYLKTNPNGADHTLVTLGLDGLFLDTIDSASPFSVWPYRWTTGGMSDLIGWLRQQYPDKILFANRGLFYFDPLYANAYAHTIRPYIDADMYESYYADGSRASWAGKVNTEARKPDGFKVVALDYILPTDTAGITDQMREVFNYNWADYISSSSLNEIRYDVFHRHAVDINPPTWNSSIGVSGGIPGDQSVRLLWNNVTDQSLPVSFDVYYSSARPFSIALATKLPGVPAIRDTDSGDWMYTVSNLTNYTTYDFVVRARDAMGNEDQNLAVFSATPPASSSTIITINGDFSDWASVSSLNQPPNPTEPTGDVGQAGADITDLWAFNSTDNLFLSYAVGGSFAYAPYFYHIFIDVDEDAGTGYRYQDSAAVGAEFMVENTGLWEYTGTGGSNWSWTPAAGMTLATTGGRVELSIPLSTLDKTPAPGGGVRLMLQNNLATAPYSLVDVAPDSFARESYLFQFNVTGVQDQHSTVAVQTELLQNYPNPFNASSNITFAIAEAGPVSLKVYDLLGREVASLVDGEKPPGVYTARFTPGEGASAEVSSGVYFYRLLTRRSAIVRSMILLK
jgi:hypothetical protein